MIRMVVGQVQTPDDTRFLVLYIQDLRRDSAGYNSTLELKPDLSGGKAPTERARTRTGVFLT